MLPVACEDKVVVVIECEGGSDKWFDGHRKDTQPIVDALQAQGVRAEVLFYRDEWADKLLDYIAERACGYISRVNPGSIPGGEEQFLAFLQALTDRGLIGMSPPDVMVNFGAKDALSKLAGTGLVPDDTYAYYDIATFRERFPVSLSYGERVLKQNRGSTGSGIWRVRVDDDEKGVEAGKAVPLDTIVRCTEAVDNHTEQRTLGEFLDFCEQYLEGVNGLVVDMRFLPRIKEGEIRVLMVGALPVYVVHKKPAEGEEAFSATLFSGARYTYDSPSNWPALLEHLLRALPLITDRLGGFTETPLLWTADFILDTDESGKDLYRVGEFNCSCVGFTGHEELGIQNLLADEVIRRIRPKPVLVVAPEPLIPAAIPSVPAVC